MKNFLIVFPLLTLFSCGEQNDSVESKSTEVDTTQSNPIWINDTLRVVHDTVVVLNNEGQAEYFYSYDNYENLK